MQARQPVAQLRQVGGPVAVQIHRVQAKGGEQACIGLHQVPQSLPILLINPQHHHAPYAEFTAVGEDFPSIAVGAVPFDADCSGHHCAPLEVDLSGTNSDLFR